MACLEPVLKRVIKFRNVKPILGFHLYVFIRQPCHSVEGTNRLFKFSTMFRTVFLIFVGVGMINCQVKEGLYRIESHIDHLHLTTEGANTAFARVVGENWQNFGEQRWKVEKSGTGVYSLMPEKHTTNNALSFYKDESKKHALPEQWSFLDVGRGYFQIKNERTGECLISNGRRKVVLEGKCDRHLPDRHWRFISI